VLAALRTVDRPMIPRTPAPPEDAIPRARRIAIPIDVRLRHANTTIETHSRDISTSGLFVLTTATLEVGVEVDAILLLPGAEPFMEDEHACRARVARRAADGYGLELIAPPAALLAALAALA
jgi:hypothetical protein